MQTRLWLATAAAVAVTATGALVAAPLLDGQAPAAPPKDTPPAASSIASDVREAVDQALKSAGLHDGSLTLDVQRAVADATQAAQDAVKDLDIDVIVDDAWQELPGMAWAGSGRPRLGVSTRDVTADEARAAGLSGITGAWVSDVAADSAAAKVGLQAGDIIVTLDGETVRSARQLGRLVSESPDGRALQIAYVRGTARTTVSVTPEVQTPRAMTWKRRDDGQGPVVRQFERRVVPGAPAPGPDRRFEMILPRGEGGGFAFRDGPGRRVFAWTGRGRLGVMVQPVSDQLATYFGVKEGVLVTSVTENSAAAKAGIKAGDVITSVNGKPVTDVGDVMSNLEGVEDGKTVPVVLTRDRKIQSIDVTLQAPANTSGDRPVTRRQRFTA